VNTPQVPLAYIVCQKRIATKLFQTSGAHGAPPGTMVTSLQSMQYKTFYLVRAGTNRLLKNTFWPPPFALFLDDAPTKI